MEYVENQQVVDGVTYRYSSDWIHSLESAIHWQLYWRQQEIMHPLVSPHDCMMEMGVGSGFAANYLRSKEIQVTTIDIDAAKQPDIVANIVTYDFPQQFDHVMAFEILEHIPFSEAELLLAKLSQVTKGYLFLSVPRNEMRWTWFEIKLPKLPKFAWEFIRKKQQIAEHHFWEINDGNISQATLEQTFKQAGFRIVNLTQEFPIMFYTLESTRP